LTTSYILFLIAFDADFDRLQEYCQMQTFRPGCWKNEVVVVQRAIYGRRRVGKCIGSEEANMFQDPRYFGCSEDVLHIVDAKCSGRKECEISIPDPDLDGTNPCLPGLKMFLEVSYACLAGNISRYLIDFAIT